MQKYQQTSLETSVLIVFLNNSELNFLLITLEMVPGQIYLCWTDSLSTIAIQTLYIVNCAEVLSLYIKNCICNYQNVILKQSECVALDLQHEPSSVFCLSFFLNIDFKDVRNCLKKKLWKYAIRHFVTISYFQGKY